MQIEKGGKEEAREALDQLAPRKMTSTIEVAVTDDASGELLQQVPKLEDAKSNVNAAQVSAIIHSSPLSKVA